MNHMDVNRIFINIEVFNLDVFNSSQSANYLTFAGGFPLSVASISEMSRFL